MAAPNPQRQNFGSLYQAAVGRMLDAREELKALRERGEATGLIAAISQDDLVGSLVTLEPTDFTNAVSALDALEMVLTDFTKTPPQPTPALTALLKFRP